MSRLPEEEHLNKAFGWAARETSGVHSLFKFLRREKDVAFKVFYCEICHTDLHNGKNDWAQETANFIHFHIISSNVYPLVPGHEIVGQVTEVESKVEKLKVGDKVGVGCMVGFCHSGDNCTNNLENYCPKLIATYGGKYYDRTVTYGGFANTMVVDDHFIIRIPHNLPLDAPDLHIRVIGLGGIGHLAIKFDKAMRAKVTVISTSINKKKAALENLSVDSFFAVNGTLDGIIDTVSAQHPLLPLLGLLKTHGKLVLFGALEKPLELPTFPLLQGKSLWKIIEGSLIGGIRETQEMIDYAVKQSIKPNIEIIPIDYVNTAIELLLKVDVKCQFVIDIGNMLKPTS
ncbi:hypothetical protein ES288_D11G242100v1 [Gossypium darwinii]|uniref:Uncharacterized protein n=1 Tax=Gossypium darwinii TaxID=34276 RepID=A0A5D2AQI5_GOSDA|nr:hypothetical protein ES288_D11G242100v1 [Gossypium darwinii]